MATTTTVSMVEAAAIMGITKARISQMISAGLLKADKVLDPDKMMVSWRVHTDSIRERVMYLVEQRYWTLERSNAVLEVLLKTVKV